MATNGEVGVLFKKNHTPQVVFARLQKEARSLPKVGPKTPVLEKWPMSLHLVR